MFLEPRPRLFPSPAGAEAPPVELRSRERKLMAAATRGGGHPRLALRFVRGVALLAGGYSALCLTVPQSYDLGSVVPVAILLGSITGGYLLDARAMPNGKPSFLLYNILLCLGSVPLLALIRSQWRDDQDFGLNLGQFAALNLAILPAAYVVKLVIDGVLGQAD